MRQIAAKALELLDILTVRVALWLFPLLVFLHNPARLLRPEMWGEDGPVWYADAYRFGLESLLFPAGSYLNSVQRLVAIAVQPVPLVWVPFLFQLTAILIQSAPAILLVSSRLDSAWPDRRSRCLFALLFLLMPNAPETAAGLTNSQWYLALVAFLIIVSSPPKGLLGRSIETLVLLVAGFSGPFGILILPAALWETIVAKRENRPDGLRRLAALGAAGAVQIALILFFAGEGRNTAPLGATFDLLVRITSLISLGAQLGYKSLTELSGGRLLLVSPLPYLAAFLSMLLIAVAVARGPRILAQFLIFATGVFGLALAKPLISLTQLQWPLMVTPPSGNRYFLFPMIAWWGALFVLAGSQEWLLKVTARALLAFTLLVAVPRDWGNLLDLPATDFAERARAFEASPPGTVMEFEIHPPSWKFTLTR